MLNARITCCTVAVAAAAGAFASLGTASGEPKNEAPFTRPAVQHVGWLPSQESWPTPRAIGEPKNELPFTRPSAATATTFVVRHGSGFDWTDAAIGAVVALGAAAVGAGALMIVRGHEGRGDAVQA